MNATETARLCRVIASLAPAQRFDEETPAVWHAVLIDVQIADALEAVKVIARRDRFVAPADIVTEVRKIRAERLAASDRILPDVDPDDVPGWLAARRSALAALADGRTTAPAALEGPVDARLAAALPGVLRRPERPRAADYSATPLDAITATVTRAEATAQERERARQIAALAEVAATDA